MAEYAAGTPIWVDVSSTDMDKTRAFYTGLFGWTAEVSPDEKYGGYTIFNLEGRMVAGAGPTFGPDVPPAWASYIKTDDAAATAAKITAAGGTVMMGPMEVPEQGTMAVCADATGATVSLWQPGGHRGAQVFNDPGAFCWNELYTRDMAKARDFYRDVFGWSSSEREFGQGMYTMFELDGKAIAGGMDMGFLPAEVPPHWLVYFTVKDTDASVAKTKELGGTVVRDPEKIEMGTFAILRDSVGATFAVIGSGGES